MSRIGPRAPASGSLVGRRSLADLLWVANTRHGPGGHWFARVTRDDGDHDHLRDAGDAVRYLADHDVALPTGRPDSAALDDLASIREMVRGLLDPSAGWTPQARSILDRTRYGLDEAGRLAADGDGWTALIGDLLLPLLELVAIRDRLAICGNPVCRLIFLDGSRNGSRRWCDDAGCGNRHRVRRFRRRGVAPA